MNISEFFLCIASAGCLSFIEPVGYVVFQPS